VWRFTQNFIIIIFVTEVMDDPPHAVRAIDAYFADLRREFGSLLPDRIFNPVRASCVLAPNLDDAKIAEKMVGATGIEPVTPAMSTQCSYR
jgi:hypothetical protein